MCEGAKAAGVDYDLQAVENDQAAEPELNLCYAMLERQPDAVDQLRIKIVIAIIGMNSIEFVMFVSIVVRPLTLTFGGVIFPSL